MDIYCAVRTDTGYIINWPSVYLSGALDYAPWMCPKGHFARLSYMDPDEYSNEWYFEFFAGDWSSFEGKQVPNWSVWGPPSQGRVGNVNLNATFTFSFKKFVEPTAQTLEEYTTGYIRDSMDGAFSVYLEYGTTYYFSWDCDTYEGYPVYESTLTTALGAEVVSAYDTGYAPFIYECDAPGYYTWVLTNWLNTADDAQVIFRSIESSYRSVYTPEHLCDQMDYTFLFESHYFYMIQVEDDDYTYTNQHSNSLLETGLYADWPIYTLDTNVTFSVDVYMSGYMVDWIGGWTVTVWRSPWPMIDPVTVTTTVAGGATTVTGDSVTVVTTKVKTTTTTETESPGFELVVLFAVVVSLVAVRKFRKK
jgi:hypothetical protein